MSQACSKRHLPLAAQSFASLQWGSQLLTRVALASHALPLLHSTPPQNCPSA